MLAFDQRGHGRGLGWAGGYRLEDCADDVAAVAAALGIDRLIVVGYSMGGLIAQLVWRRHRQLTAGLVLCATASNIAGAGPAHSASLLTAALLAPVLMASAPDLPGWAVPGLATGGTGGLAVAPPALAVPILTAPAPAAAEVETRLRAELAELRAIGAQAQRRGVAVDAADAMARGIRPEALRRAVLDQLAARAEASSVVALAPQPAAAAGESPIVRRARERAAAI